MDGLFTWNLFVFLLTDDLLILWMLLVCFIEVTFVKLFPSCHMFI